MKTITSGPNLLTATALVVGTIILLSEGCDMSDKDNNGISPTRVVGKAMGHKESYRHVPGWDKPKE